MLTSESVRADLPQILTPLPGPRAKAIMDRDNAVLSTSYTRCYPLVVDRGQRLRLLRMWMATGFWISTPGSRWLPRVTVIHT